MCDHHVPGAGWVGVVCKFKIPAVFACEGAFAEEGVCLAGRPGGLVVELEVEFDFECVKECSG